MLGSTDNLFDCFSGGTRSSLARAPQTGLGVDRRGRPRSRSKRGFTGPAVDLCWAPLLANRKAIFAPALERLGVWLEDVHRIHARLRDRRAAQMMIALTLAGSRGGWR